MVKDVFQDVWYMMLTRPLCKIACEASEVLDGNKEVFLNVQRHKALVPFLTLFHYLTL
jgi:hypothetical protein